MRAVLDPFSFVVISVVGWMNQHQHHVIEYLIEENRVLREQIGGGRMRFSDDQRRRLAAKAKKLGRKLLAQVVTIVTPETLLAWHRNLIALLITSANQVHNLMEVANQSGLEEAVRRGLQHILVVSVGPISTEALLAYGIAPDMEPTHPKMGQLVYETAEKAKVLLSKKRAEFV